MRWKYQRYVKDYLRCIASVDDGVGRMLAYLKEAGLEKKEEKKKIQRLIIG